MADFEPLEECRAPAQAGARRKGKAEDLRAARALLLLLCCTTLGCVQREESRAPATLQGGWVAYLVPTAVHRGPQSYVFAVERLQAGVPIPDPDRIAIGHGLLCLTPGASLGLLRIAPSQQDDLLARVWPHEVVWRERASWTRGDRLLARQVEDPADQQVCTLLHDVAYWPCDWASGKDLQGTSVVGEPSVRSEEGSGCPCRTFRITCPRHGCEVFSLSVPSVLADEAVTRRIAERILRLYAEEQFVDRGRKVPEPSALVAEVVCPTRGAIHHVTFPLTSMPTDR